VTTTNDTPHWRVQQTNRLATASMVCGMLALVFTPLAILAIVFGHIARGQIRRTREAAAARPRLGWSSGTWSSSSSASHSSSRSWSYLALR
jgi:hypothetical protein